MISCNTKEKARGIEEKKKKKKKILLWRASFQGSRVSFSAAPKLYSARSGTALRLALAKVSLPSSPTTGSLERGISLVTSRISWRPSSSEYSMSLTDTTSVRMSILPIQDFDD